MACNDQTRFEACCQLLFLLLQWIFCNTLALLQIELRFQVYLWKWYFLKTVNVWKYSHAFPEEGEGREGDSVNLYHWKHISSVKCRVLCCSSPSYLPWQRTRCSPLLSGPLHALHGRGHRSTKAVHWHSLGERKILINLSGWGVRLILSLKKRKEKKPNSTLP